MSKKFNIDNLTSELNNKVIITGENLVEPRGAGLLNAPGVTGIMLNELSLSGSNDFGALFDTSSLINRISSSIDKAAVSASLLSPDLSEFLRTLAPRNTFATAVQWTGSSKPVFPINLLFLKLRNRENIAQKVLSLYKTVYPTQSREFSVSDLKIANIGAPLGYLPTANNSARGTLALQIGQWFRATNLIMRSVDFTFSSEISTDGFPLYAVGSVVLEPWRSITFEEFSAYFINNVGVSSRTVGLPPGED